MKDNNIKYKLDKELKKENITVSEELIQRTLYAIESGEPSNLQKYQNKKQYSKKENPKKENQIKGKKTEKNSFKEVKTERDVPEKNIVKEEIDFKEKNEGKEKINFQKNKEIQEEFSFKVKNNWKQLRKVSIMVAGISIILVGTYVIRIIEDESNNKKINTMYIADSSMDAMPQQASEGVEEYSLDDTTKEDGGLLEGTLKNSNDDTTTSGSDDNYASKKIQSNMEESEMSDDSMDSARGENNTKEQEENQLENHSESMLNSIEDTGENDAIPLESEFQEIKEVQKLNQSLWSELNLTIQEIKTIRVVNKESEFVDNKEVQNEKKQLEDIDKVYQELNQYQLTEEIEIEEVEYEKQQEIEQELYLYTAQEETEGIKIEIRKDYLIIEKIPEEEQKNKKVFLYERNE